MTRKGYDTDLTTAEWALLEPLVQRSGKIGRPVKLELREIANALFYWERTGCQWRLIPADFPNWTSARYYFDKWTQDGTWLHINDTLRRAVGSLGAARLRTRADPAHDLATHGQTQGRPRVAGADA